MSVTSEVMDAGPSLSPGTARDYGDQALLLEFDSTADVLAWTATLTAAQLLGVVDIVPASRTILIKLADPRYQAPTRQRLGKLRLQPGSAPVRPIGQADVTIDVVYDGADLHEVAKLTGMTPEQVIAAHTGSQWQVGFMGFAPGFAYLVGGDERLQVPRRAEPRTSVPAGAVALAGEFSGIYPRQSPGGWQLIGHTDAVMFDVHRDQPALLTPGTWVQFRAIG
ncbi:MULTISPECIES: 5-oxoprolinase subunit B family protein [Mycolicibacterium]|uniref:Allophanate hydrolase subunit 1 n=3 Tax=Mycolicibacterium fortuitum TaxID=1766 RepID=A0AAE4VA24_MYCFO|nr:MULTISPECIES: allophanate hydrolase subunit 1 [Mycolicibacterium]CRL68809.1 allophanate hydrolase subunit 1 [Mycolicibacter nonchromogenicus]AMD53680.1 allophanate hydrolase [Mycolicibacterium fortuitum subsp. fortuitum DSM 46621 = ATCC 6841 = JCM 6387]MBP3082724.1 allophanate hydrolase subunit 1 [Mycolicibacterium fortuitum]MCA4723026.1 allophanate hydrolase subunit 1 [Mycolicibacterium fortuitum]MCV7139356.1 allophanate hydrolase subunit 1 [Mycolicibacterium fortuitum]